MVYSAFNQYEYNNKNIFDKTIDALFLPARKALGGRKIYLETCQDEPLSLNTKILSAVFLIIIFPTLISYSAVGFSATIAITASVTAFAIFAKKCISKESEIVNSKISKIPQENILDLKVAKHLTDPTTESKGEINFKPEDLSFLNKVFSNKNIPLLQSRSTILSIDGKDIAITHFGQNIPVFELDVFPGIIFKFESSDNQIKARYEAMQEAKKVCLAYKLDRLVVPECSLIQVCSGGKDILIVAEKKYPIEPGIIAQRRQYEKCELDIEEIIRQLTILICKTGFSDVKWNNIPLVFFETILKVPLIDLEPIQGRGAKDGLIGWGNKNSGWGDPTPGLISCCPRYAETIYQTAKEHLSQEKFEALRLELEEALTKAKKINQRKESIEKFHRDKLITILSPAIPTNVLESLKFENSQKEIYRSIINDINQVIAAQLETHPHLVNSRRWRVTGDCYTADSNWNETIYNNLRLIKKEILPQLQAMGVIHSFLNSKEAEDLDLDLSKRFGAYDIIVQF